MRQQAKLAIICVGAFLGMASSPLWAQGVGKYFAPKDQVVAIRAGHLFELSIGEHAEQPGGAAQGRSHHGRRRDRCDSGRRARDRPERGDRASRHDRRACPCEHRRRHARATRAARSGECANRSRGRLHHRARHGFARRVQHRRSARRDRRRHRAGAAHAGRRPIDQSASHQLLPGLPVAALPRRIYRKQERQFAVARTRRRARGQAAWRRLDQDLHDPGFRRHGSHVAAGRHPGQQSVVDARRGRGDRGRGAPARPEGGLPHLWRRRHEELPHRGRRCAQSSARARRRGGKGPVAEEASLRPHHRRFDRA